jgi:hypothetical protein
MFPILTQPVGSWCPPTNPDVSTTSIARSTISLSWTAPSTYSLHSQARSRELGKRDGNRRDESIYSATNFQPPRQRPWGCMCCDAARLFVGRNARQQRCKTPPRTVTDLLSLCVQRHCTLDDVMDDLSPAWLILLLTDLNHTDTGQSMWAM